MGIQDQWKRPLFSEAQTMAGRLMRRFKLPLVLLFVSFCVGLVAQGHDVITTKLTWNREVSRIVYTRCATCHRQGGTSFSLMNYQEARPWAKAIEEEVLERRMPPWGAVKGFGDFRNDQALTQEQLELIANWVEGGAPEGDPNDLPPSPKFATNPQIMHGAGEIVVSGECRINRPFSLDGVWPQAIRDTASLQITVELPDGTLKPLVWLRDYTTRFGHPFLLRTPMALPAGSVIHGVPAGSSLALLPVIPGTNGAVSTCAQTPK
jgi:mono/diheme cytochrome c family protein